MRLVHTQHGTDVAFSVGCIALLPSECWFMRFYVSWLRLARLLLNLISDDVIVVLPSEKNNKKDSRHNMQGGRSHWDLDPLSKRLLYEL